MTALTAKQDILKWIQEFVEKPNPLLNGWPPCPYAKEARLNNRIRILICEQSEISATLESEATSLLKGPHEVTIVALEKDQMLSLPETTTVVQKFRDAWAPKDIYLLKDHPLDSEVTNGVSMNHGRYQMFFLQRLSALQTAAAELKKAGYYDNWDPEYLGRVVSAREKYHGK